MNIFIPEIIYNRIKTNPKFITLYDKFNTRADQNSHCIIAYNNFIDDDNNYEEFARFMATELTAKESKIWECFCVDVDYDETLKPAEWSRSKTVIDQYKMDQDIDVKMYAYYMELANTADHESDLWIDNVNQSIEIWESNSERLFDPRLYTKYYWDKHEQFSFYLKMEKNKDILEAFRRYDVMDTEIKDFLFSKYDTKYFKDIINHKTLYTAVLFWGSVNDVSLDNPEKTMTVLRLLDEKIQKIEHKYSDFNIHLIEWLWINFKWWFDMNQPEKYSLVWRILIDTISSATNNKPRLIKALNHHNFNYTTRFLVFVANLYEIEESIIGSKNSDILSMNWTPDERRMILSGPDSITGNDRIITAKNYRRNMTQSVKNRLWF